jgi:MoCo/4Fe-4S cofactor protein with predicted Tat translocation signal
MNEQHPLDLKAVQAQLATASGPEYWRSLEELANTGEFQEFLHREFPDQASELTDPVGRRQFLRLMGASLALAGVSACTKQPAEAIVPYVRAPEEIIPGKPLFFATALTLGGAATGVLVESHMGRPTKVEGNPGHPGSLGATDLFAQAAILGLYDPDRSQTLTHAGDIRTFAAFLDAFRKVIDAKKASQGRGLRLLTGTVTSPTLARQLREVLQAFPNAKHHQYEACGRDHVRAGVKAAFGTDAAVQYAFGKAKVVLALDADFLGSMPGAVRYIRDFAAGRRVRGSSGEMSRLYAVESTLTNTGAKADHRLAARPGDVEVIARSLAAKLGVAGAPTAVARPGWEPFIASAASDLTAHRGACLVVAGDEQPTAVHALAHAMNEVLGNQGATITYTEPVEAFPTSQADSLRELVADINAGIVDALVILGGNPAYDAPADLSVADALAKVTFSVHLGLYADETSARCQWHVPEAHVLESWSDARAFDGTASIVQPLIAPLYDGKSAHELLAMLQGAGARPAYDLVRDTWRTMAAAAGAVDFEAFWRKAVHDGVIPGTTAAATPLTARDVFTIIGPGSAPTSGLELAIRPDPTVYDGRFANNGWLQETPKPFTKLVWDNSVHLSSATADRLGVANHDVVEIALGSRKVAGPVFVVPGHPDDSVSVTMGYGRRRAGRVANGIGFDVAPLRTSAAPWHASGVQVTKTGRRYTLTATVLHHSMEGRAIVRSATLETFTRNPGIIQGAEFAPPKTLTMYQPHEYKGYAWGMAVDINSCVGCNACMVACQAENNVPVVGKEQVERGREMHWIRVDTYYTGSPSNPEAYHQPVMCQHCEDAPCEVVCPVAATTHSDEGLNDMVYNRCVGTRYCANNCPYKVRRFNFLLFQDWETKSLKLGRNPDVTVRSRGVMEKCTYCVQRINEAKIEAEKQDRTVRDGEIVTACQQVCPAEAIVFGDINDPNSRVSTLRRDALNYSLLGELNTRPRTTYLAALKNPNPALGGGTPAPDDHDRH